MKINRYVLFAVIPFAVPALSLSATSSANAPAPGAVGVTATPTAPRAAGTTSPTGISGILNTGGVAVGTGIDSVNPNGGLRSNILNTTPNNPLDSTNNNTLGTTGTTGTTGTSGATPLPGTPINRGAGIGSATPVAPQNSNTGQ